MTALLSLVQWLSPAFPTGGFAYSHGMEAAMAAGQVHDAASAGAWIGDVLRFGAGHADAVILAHALRGAEAGTLDDLARALAVSAERREETLAQGTAFARTVSAITGRDLPPRALPVAVGEAAAALGLPAAQVAEVYLHAFAGNLVSIAVRAVPLGQTEGQGVLAGLHGVIAEVAADALETGLDAIGTCALGADIAAMRHEVQEVRLFCT